MKAQAQAAEQASDVSQAGGLRHGRTPSAGEIDQAGGMSAALDPAAEFLLPGQLLSMQGVAGNAAVSRLVAARGNAVQRAPEAAAGLDHKARVDRLRLAIKQNFLVRQHLIVDIEAVATALGGMTAGEGRAVKTEYAKQTGWNLGWLLSGELEIEGKPVVTDVGPANRRRLLTLLSGTVAEPAVDPMAAMETGEKLGRFVGSFVGMEDELGAQAGAVAAVAARDQNVAAEAKASGARTRAQAIELKVWLDKGQKEKVFSLLAKLAKPAAADEKKALSDAYAAQFGEQLYTALTKRFKGRDQERVIALWMEDTATAERLALQADLEKLKKAEAQAEKFAPLAKSGIMAEPSKQIQQQRTDARAAVEGRLESLGQEGGDKLQEVLGEGSEGQAVAEQLGVGKDAVITALVRGDRPEALALRLARSDREGTLKPAEIEETLLELRQAAEKEASRQRSAAGRDNTTPALSSAEVVNSYFARFQARFAAERPGRIFVQLLAGSVGNKIERERNTALLLQQGVLPEWQELYFAISSSRKDMERVRQILGSKKPSEIRELADEYRAKTPGNRDLSVDLLGTIEERLLIEKPTADDYMRGRAPKDLAAAREVYEEKKRLLRGGAFEEQSKPGGSEAALAQLAEELAADRARPPGKPGGPPVSAEIVGSLASIAASEGEVRRLREEAAWVFGRVSSIDTAVMENRGSFARVRDWSGNLEHELVMNARRDAADAHRAVDAALSQDPPDVEAARRSIGELHLIEARMTHNVGVYKQATEEAFNAFVDVAVLAVSMLASGGAAGAIMGAIRATAATIATKATLKGGAYSADEVWADIRGGVFGAGAGKLAEKLVPRLAAAYAAKAKAKGWDKGWAGAVSAKVEPAVMWEVENLISGGGAGLLEAGYQGDIDPLTESVGLTSHAMALGQHVATTPIRRRAERRRAARERARTEAESSRRAAAEEGAEPAEQAGSAEQQAERRLEPAAEPITAQPGPSDRPATSRRPPTPVDIGGLPLIGDGGRPPAPPSRPPTGPIDPVAQRLLPEDGVRSLQQLADTLDVIVRVRPMNADAIARLEPRRDATGKVLEHAAVAKPSIVKAKTINAIDEHIGAPPDSRGLVGLFEPHPPSAELPPDVLARAQERHAERLREWQNRQADYGQYLNDGTLRIEGGLVEIVDPRLATSPGGEESVYRKVAGDIDLFDITHADGSPLTPRERTELTTLLRSMGINVEHGAHEWWQQQDPGSYTQQGYEAISQRHQSVEPLIAIVPLESAQSVWAGTRLSRQPRADRPGQRITPLRDEAPARVEVEPVETPAGVATGEPTGVATAPLSPSDANVRLVAGNKGPPKGRPLVPGSTVPANLPTAREPAFDLTAPKEQMAHDAKRDLVAQQQPRTSRPTAEYAPDEPGRYVPTGETPTAGVTAAESMLVKDTADKNKLYLFKPVEAELPVERAEIRGISAGEQAPREIAASIAAQELGVPAPKSRLVTIGAQKGVLIEWHEKNTLRDLAIADHATFTRLVNSEEFKLALRNVDALDYLINNLDRATNFGNYIYEFLPDGTLRLTAIDHGLTFTSTQGRTDIKAYTRDLPESYPPDLVSKLEELDKNRDAFVDKIRPFIGDEAIPGVIHRLDLMLADMRAKAIGRP